MVGHLLGGLGFAVGSIAGIGQETPRLPNAPQLAQSQSPQSSPEQNGGRHPLSKNRVFWVIPSYRADDNSTKIKLPISRAKMKVALDDEFDPWALLVAGVFAAATS
jgi:hypothetical protein